ncbi:MAG: Twin-arginine translocation pathway signal, partial [Polaromonas sp.]|nr:Twin-arginine translocation pathway signal [Polaromonas sp.]
CEICTWMGGSHWPIRNYAINQVPGWHQNRTLEPLVSGVLKEVGGIAQAAIFDDGPGSAADGKPVAIAVYARGSLARPVSLAVSVKGRGKLGKTRLTLPAGANGLDEFSYRPAPNEVAEISYAAEAGWSGPVPPPRKVFSLAAPVAHAATSVRDAAMAIVAKYGACKWDMADAYTDYVLGAPAGPGQPVRAVSDSGYGSSPGNAMEMVVGFNNDSPGMGAMRLPVMGAAGGRAHVDFGAPGTWGFWCKKSARMPGVQPDPKNRTPYDLEDAHFVLAAVGSPGPGRTGVVFQASKAEAAPLSELRFDNGRPGAAWVDGKGVTTALVGPAAVAAGVPVVLGLASGPGRQALRVDGVEVGAGTASLAPAGFAQMLIGWGFVSYYPRDSFGGRVYAVIAGKGTPSPAEFAVLERYLGVVSAASGARDRS